MRPLILLLFLLLPADRHITDACGNSSRHWMPCRQRWLVKWRHRQAVLACHYWASRSSLGIRRSCCGVWLWGHTLCTLLQAMLRCSHR
jgi:hypothetical protein